MCTLTYIPIGKERFLWTQNRDESPSRTASGLVYDHTHQWVYPKEPLSGGTWISITQKGRLVSLLNGAFEQNKYQPSVRSRGLMLLDFLNFSSLTTFAQQYDFNGIEPFTMVVYEQQGLWELRWDKVQKYIKKLNTAQAHIWSSSTLYPAPIKALRREWFANYLHQYPLSTPESILKFHREAGTGDLKNDLIMDRGLVKTVSITAIVKDESSLDMTYYDLIRKIDTKERLSLKGKL